MIAEYLKFKRLPNCPEKQLTKAYEWDGGFDLYSADSFNLMPGESKVILTGVCVEIPKGYVGIIKMKSGLSINKKVETGAGVIDSGYTGQIKGHIYNFSQQAIHFKRGSKFSQLLILPAPLFHAVEVNELSDSERGENGFGSSGLK